MPWANARQTTANATVKIGYKLCHGSALSRLSHFSLELLIFSICPALALDAIGNCGKQPPMSKLRVLPHYAIISAPDAIGKCPASNRQQSKVAEIKAGLVKPRQQLRSKVYSAVLQVMANAASCSYVTAPADSLRKAGLFVWEAACAAQ
ncbi:MAG: hypothetical protein JNJ65_00055 [Cyclobacteriaceae bacterium]|nr:hypothetical protein [Cyclobacteriaceae bacterium]